MAGSTAIDAALVARFREALDRLNPDSGKIGLAVSGGPDSMAMLLLAQEAIAGGFEVATVDHGLRPEARDECALVVAACEERGVPCEVLSVEVGEGNVQARAREARYDALFDWMLARNLDTLATAHHADDQAETLLMRLNRGSGVLGLGSIRSSTLYIVEDRPMYLVRPLLEFRRSELQGLVSLSDVPVAEDPSNRDDKFDRARLRKSLQAADWLNIPGIAASARHLDEAGAALTWAANEIYRERVSRTRDGFRFVQMEPKPPRVLLMIVVEQIFEMLGSSPRGGQLSELVTKLQSGQRGNLAGVAAIIKNNDWVFRPEPPRRTS